MSMVGQRLLTTFFDSVQFANPALAEQITPDIRIVGINALGADKSGGQEAADRLRRAAFDMPVIFERTLNSALEELGY